MLNVACCLWDANEHSRHFSRGYDESWANKLYAGFQKHLTRPFRFVVFTDRERQFAPGIEQERLWMNPPHYGACTEPFRTDEPTIFCGLDTIVVGNIDHLADYALTAAKPAIPRDPYAGVSRWARTNAVVIAPKGCKAMLWDGYANENDMDWINTKDTDLLDERFPNEVVSYKGRIQYCGLEAETRMVFFHGAAKPSDLPHVGWVHRNWWASEPVEAVA